MSKPKAHNWNPYFKKTNRETIDIEQLCELLENGDRLALSQALTIVEDCRDSAIPRKQELLRYLLPVKKEYNTIGITGAPGVGKSTAIESLGTEWIAQGHKIAVLSIDPSSQTTGGSILGDKTRMNSLGTNERAFIRPSPAGETLGGVAQSTYLSTLICAAAGYELIVIETVGVGQSEVAVSKMCDLFTLFIEPGAGDDLQGIKRGIMELADLVFITKSNNNISLAKNTKRAYTHALHLMTAKEHGLETKVNLHDSMDQAMCKNSSQLISQYINQLSHSGFTHQNRERQRLHQMNKWTHYFLMQQLEKTLHDSKIVKSIHSKVELGHLDAFSAALELTRYV